MNRPLIITDCDEVLLHMVVPFREWLDESHDIHFDMHDRGFGEALRHKDSGQPVDRALAWELLLGFFETQMHRPTPIAARLEPRVRMARMGPSGDMATITHRTQMRQADCKGQVRTTEVASEDG